MVIGNPLLCSLPKRTRNRSTQTALCLESLPNAYTNLLREDKATWRINP